MLLIFRICFKIIYHVYWCRAIETVCHTMLEVRRVLSTEKNSFLIGWVKSWMLWSNRWVKIFDKSEFVISDIIDSNYWSLYMRFRLSITLYETKFIICFFHLRLFWLNLFLLILIIFFLLIFLLIFIPKRFEFILSRLCYENDWILGWRKSYLSKELIIEYIFDMLIEFFSPN